MHSRDREAFSWPEVNTDLACLCLSPVTVFEGRDNCGFCHLTLRAQYIRYRVALIGATKLSPELVTHLVWVGQPPRWAVRQAAVWGKALLGL